MFRIFLVIAVIVTGVSAPPAAAGMLATDQVPRQGDPGWSPARPDPGVRKALEAELLRYGLAPDEAAARIDAMDDAELAVLSDNFRGLPAGREVVGTPKQAMVVFAIILIVLLLG